MVALEDRPRHSYPLGLVQELLFSADGVARTAKVKTASGMYVRPTVQLIPLEVHMDSMDEPQNEPTESRQSNVDTVQDEPDAEQESSLDSPTCHETVTGLEQADTPPSSDTGRRVRPVRQSAQRARDWFREVL